MNSMNQKIDVLRGKVEELPNDHRSWVLALLDSVAWAARGQSLAGCETLRAQAYNGLVSDARAALDRAGLAHVTLERKNAQQEATTSSGKEEKQRGQAAGDGAAGGDTKRSPGARKKAGN